MPATDPRDPAYPHAGPSRHGWALIALAGIFVLHAAVNAWWLASDNLPRMGDDAQHAVFAREMHAIATNEEWSVRGRIRALATPPTGIYPPLFHYAAMGSGLIFGPERAGFAVVNTLVLGLLMIASYALAAHWLRPRYALLAAATCSALPMIAGVSRLCVTDLLTALWVTLGLLVLIRVRGFASRGNSVLFGVVMGLGLLTRWMTPLYLAVPVLVVLIAGWRAVRAPSLPPDRQRMETRRWLNTLALMAAITLAMAAPWYAPRVPQLLGVYTEYFRPMDGPSPFHAGGSGAASAVAPQAPVERPVYLRDFGPLEARTWISYGLMLNNKGLFLPVSIMTAAGMLIAMLSTRRREFKLLLAAVIGSYVLLTLFWAVRAPAPRYLIPMLPFLAVLPALALQTIPSERWRRRGVTIFSAWLVFQFLHFSVAPVSGLARVDIPLFRDHPLVKGTGDHGLSVWTSHVNASGARIGPPYRGFNWIDHAFDTMRAHEEAVLPGNRHQANVMLAGALKPALESVQHRHWPVENPLDPQSPRVRRMVNPFVPVTLDALAPEWLDAVSVEGGSGRVPVEYRDSQGAWHPLTEVSVHDGHGFQSLPRTRATAVRRGPGAQGTVQAWRFEPQARPFILIEQADRPRDWPLDRIEVADYLVVVSRADGRIPDELPEGFEELDSFEARLHGYWDERNMAVLARPQVRPVALDTTAGLRVEVVEAGDTLAGRWDMPWWRLGRFNAPGIEGRPEAWEVSGPVVIEVTLPAPVALGRLEAVATTEDTATAWAYRSGGDWSPIETGSVPPGAIEALRLTLTPGTGGGIVGLQQVVLEPAQGDAP